VDVGWSRLADLNVHEGKLLGCSFNQSCVGVWVVDLAVCCWLATFVTFSYSLTMVTGVFLLILWNVLTK
jgi:hypothetical protein